MGQACITLELSSRFLNHTPTARLLLPTTAGKAEKALVLLHGAQEGPETILENCPLAAFSEALDLAVLLPALDQSFGLDWGEGQNYRSYLLRELLPCVGERCPSFASRERCAVGGISMGGFGAISIALSEPDHFTAAFSLSGALDLTRAAQLFRICQLVPPGDLLQVAARPEAQLVPRLEELAGKSAKQPALYLAWGDGDWFRRANRSFSEQAGQLGFSIRGEESPGLHDWAFWKQQLPLALRWAAELL